MAFGAWVLLLLLTVWWARKRGRSAVRWVAAVGWCLLPVYNFWVVAHCPGDCGIRVDLLLMVPVLAILGLAALWSLCAQWIKSRAQRP